MQPLSTHYRYDNADQGIEPSIKQYLDNHFLKNLKHFDNSNPRVLVVFSGGNAVGKSTLARRIGEEFGGLVLENDAVKRKALENRPELSEDRDELNKLTWRYTINLYKHLDEYTKNGLVIRDGIIDWYYDRILPIFEKANYDLFIVGFDISRKKAIELIHNRGDTPTVKEERFYKLLDDHEIHMKRFRKEYRSSVMLHDDTIFDHDLVIGKFREFLRSIQK